MAYSQHILVCSSNQPTYPGPVCLSANCLNWISLGDRKNHHIMRFERINFQIENATKLTENELNKQEGGTTERYGERGEERGGEPVLCGVTWSALWVQSKMLCLCMKWYHIHCGSLIRFLLALAKIRNVLNASNNCKGIKWYKYVKTTTANMPGKQKQRKTKSKRNAAAKQGSSGITSYRFGPSSRRVALVLLAWPSFWGMLLWKQIMGEAHERINKTKAKPKWSEPKQSPAQTQRLLAKATKHAERQTRARVKQGRS